ncbi:MAG: DEAD/DEAH box helicase [Nitrospirota bacterium]|nr:DEAD/DEAH box helicase [Nitrospirota bacterium]
MARKLPDVDPMSFLPVRYEDRRSPVFSKEFVPDVKILAAGHPVSYDSIGDVTVVTLRDEAGYFYAKFFNFTRFHEVVFRPNGRKVYLWGAPRREFDQYRGEYWSFYHPEFPDETGRIYPVYKCPKGIGQKRMREHVWHTAQQLMDHLHDEVPVEVLKQRGLPTIADALRQIHHPSELPSEKPFMRLAYRELFEMKQKIREYPRNTAQKLNANLAGFYEKLTFQLTKDQKNAIEEVSKDLTSDTAMRRIIIGDVGTGKTVVAQAAAYICCQSGYRTLVLAPTIVLAEQLYDKFREVFGESLVSLYTGSTKGDPSLIIVGTHALMYREFSAVGLVILDEQHKYGVIQRQQLLGDVHALQMTATPIPRTVSLLMQGAVELSVLKQAPYKRDVLTKVVSKEETPFIMKHLRQIINSGGKALVIFPLVEKDKGEYKSVEEKKAIWERMFPDCVLWVHGRLEEKQDIVSEFRKNPKKKILVSTSIIEIGIDVPEASILVVSGAERFGLSQLHQLRGRVGRRGNKAYCYFMYKKDIGKDKVKPLETINTGFELAELDADRRGWGDAFGTAQSGHKFKLPGIEIYKKVIEMVNEDVEIYKSLHSKEAVECSTG